MRMSKSSPHFCSFPVLSRKNCSLEENFAFQLHKDMCKRETKSVRLGCGKCVCVRFECSVAESNEDTIGWEENKSVGYCLRVHPTIPNF